MDYLMATYKLDPSQLDREIQPKDFPILAKYFDNVELYANLMNLNTADQANLKSVAASKSLQVAMNTCLNFWRRQNPAEATYRSLLKMVIHLENGELAAHICEHLAETDSEQAN